MYVFAMIIIKNRYYYLYKLFKIHSRIFIPYGQIFIYTNEK